MAALAGDVEALGRIYTDSAYLVELGFPTTRGNAAIRALVKDILVGGVDRLIAFPDSTVVQPPSAQ